MWIITKDHIATPGSPICTNDNAVGMASCDHDPSVILPWEFRIKDDDGELNYEGRSSHQDFDPLDDFAMPNAGSTTIEYKNRRSGKWEIL